MKIVVQTPKPPQALRLLLQVSDDSDGIDVALAAASQWTGERLVLVINGTGKDLSGYAGRHRFAVLCDDAGRPTRSLSEISEAFEDIDCEAFGAVVVLDTNRIYRATRCSVRDIDSIKALSPGHWDDTNEALGLVGELLTRAGMPSIFVAPPSDVYGCDADGEEIVVGTKPQAWKDLARQAHALIKLSRRGRIIEGEIAGDDWRRLGRVGQILEITGESLGRAFADLAGGRPGEAAGTTLSEATAAELAARARRAERSRADSERLRDSAMDLATLRAYQGPEAWAKHVQWFAGAQTSMAPDDADAAKQRLGWVYSSMRADLDWMTAAERTLELSPCSLHQSMGWTMAGPSLAACPARDDMPVDGPMERVAEAAMSCEREDIPAWIASLAQLVGVWTEPAFAVVCKANNIKAKGASWDAYSDEELRAVVRGLLSLASIYRKWVTPAPRTRPVLVESEPAPVPEQAPQPSVDDEPIWSGDDGPWEPVIDVGDAPQVVAAQPVPDDEIVDRIEWLIDRQAAGQGLIVSKAQRGTAVELPDPAAFCDRSEQRQLEALGFLLGEIGAFDDWDGFRSQAEGIGSSKSMRRWDADERALIYRSALEQLRRAAADKEAA